MTSSLAGLSTMLAVIANPAPPLPRGFNAYPTKYYVIHTDLDEEAVREAALRMTAMAEEYQARTKAFTGRITTRLPFHLFRDPNDYYAAGGLRRSVGVYTGDRLMAIAGRFAPSEIWKTVQHEGWHQFAHAVIGGDIPVWVDEGLAEYFEEAIFTGDGFVAGVIPQHRLERLRAQIKGNRLKTLPEMMVLERMAWNHNLSPANYNQAWSMVHFLAHANGGKYQPRFDGFLRDVSLKGLSWERAWLGNFDADTTAFERAWRIYWEEMPDHPTSRLYARARVAIMTSYLARATSRGQTFPDAAAFLVAARAGRLEAHPADWLPPSPLESALRGVDELGRWSLRRDGRKTPALVCTLTDGTTMIGTFALSKGRVKRVQVRVELPP